MSELENTLAGQLRLRNIRNFEREFRFAPDRRYRADFAFPDLRLLIEVEGGVYTGGRHVRGKGYEHDCVKYNLATMNGWRVLRFTGGMVNNQTAADCIEGFLRREGAI